MILLSATIYNLEVTMWSNDFVIVTSKLKIIADNKIIWSYSYFQIINCCR